MNYFKLQLGCFILLTYLSAIYIRNTTGNNKFKCNIYFDFLMAFASASIVFDGATAWTVNHLDVVPPILNLILHLIFFLLMDCVLFTAVLYMLDSTKGIPKNKFVLALLILPFLVCIICVFAFIGDLYYVTGKITNYSMGPSVIACYLNCFLYFIVLLATVITRRRYIEKRKQIGVISVMSLNFGILVIQMFFPEVLLTSIIAVLFVFGIYLSFEDPALRKLTDYNNVTVTGFATLVENRDNSTGGHIIRTKAYVEILLEKMKREEKYTRIVTKDFEENMKKSAPMHDIGKISTPDYILQKPGKLTDEEFSIMQEHASSGGEIIIETFADLDNPEFLKMAYEVARFHHEKWNGKGYPEGLKENEIPLSARIMAIADVFDAISAERCYRPAMPLDKCFQIIEDGSGKDFDPDLVKLFMSSRKEVEEKYEKLR